MSGLENTLDDADSRPLCELNLLAINAQYTIPSVSARPAHPDEVYTFLRDDSFVVARPEIGGFSLEHFTLNYTSASGAYPPSLKGSTSLGRFAAAGSPEKLSWSDKSGLLGVQLGAPAHSFSLYHLDPTKGTIVAVVAFGGLVSLSIDYAHCSESSKQRPMAKASQ